MRDRVTCTRIGGWQSGALSWLPIGRESSSVLSSQAYRDAEADDSERANLRTRT